MAGRFTTWLGQELKDALWDRPIESWRKDRWWWVTSCAWGVPIILDEAIKQILYLLRFSPHARIKSAFVDLLRQIVIKDPAAGHLLRELALWNVITNSMIAVLTGAAIGYLLERKVWLAALIAMLPYCILHAYMSEFGDWFFTSWSDLGSGNPSYTFNPYNMITELLPIPLAVGAAVLVRHLLTKPAPPIPA